MQKSGFFVISKAFPILTIINYYNISYKLKFLTDLEKLT